MKHLFVLMWFDRETNRSQSIGVYNTRDEAHEAAIDCMNEDFCDEYRTKEARAEHSFRQYITDHHDDYVVEETPYYV